MNTEENNKNLSKIKEIRTISYHGRKINFFYDNDAAVWIATSNDMPGLVLEQKKLPELVEEAKVAMDELLEINAKVGK